MQYLELTLDSAAANVALDEALLEMAERGGQPCEWLRIWEPTSPVVVVGRSSSVGREVNRDRCDRDGVPVIRRSSGGASIVAAPGCLMYAVVLSVERRPQLQAVNQAHRTALGPLVPSIGGLIEGLRMEGISDLTVGNQKVSGNALRCRRTHILYHGTLLYDMSLELVSRYLGAPARQPDYREGRSHQEFVTNLPADRGELIRAIRDAWGSPPAAVEWPRDIVEKLVENKYTTDDWNLRIA